MRYNIWNAFISNQSIKARFLTSLFVNIVRMGLSFIGGIIIARNLGPAGYGNYNFLLGSFVSIATLLDMGTSKGFYTFLSQRKRSPKFYLYYLSWLGIQFIIVLFLISFIFPDTWRDAIWLGHTKGMIILAFVASFMMNKVWETATHAGESIRYTVIVQLHNILIAGLYLCIILVMVFLHRLTVSNLFIAIAISYFFLSFILAKRLKDNLIVREDIKVANVINEFSVYCAPLVTYAIASFLYAFSNLWMLQKFGGPVEQGFYSIGLRFSVICLIATNSMLKVFWKEITEANELGNKERLYQLYTRISRGLCFVGAAASCFLIPFSKEILVILLGPRYVAGWLCLAIMFLYPIYQSLAQITASYFHAIAQTKLYSKIGIIMMIFSLPVTYFLLAKPYYFIPGFGLGSVGLALKMVVLAIISVNVSIFFLCRLSGWRYDFLYQFENIAILFIVSFMIKHFLSSLFSISNISFHPLVLMAFCMPVYILAVGLIIYLFPELSGLKKVQVLNSIRFLKTFHKK